MKKYLLLIIISILMVANKKVIAQIEFFVKVDLTTCSYTILDSIPIIKWIAVGTSTFDKLNSRYVFHGLDNGTGNYLCTIDATNGSTISIPLMTSHFGGLKFDNATGILYGIQWTNSLANAKFVSINPTTLAYTIIHPLNLTGIGSDVTFDDVNHRYILFAGDSSGTQCLFSIDVATGNIISKPPLMGVTGIQFDNSSGNLYALRVNTNPKYFASVNVTTGFITNINAIPLVTGVAMGYPTFDEINHRYTFRGNDNSTNNYLVTLDATNGQVIWNPQFPYLPYPQNLIETKYDNSTGILYALHWGPFDVPFDPNLGIAVTENNNEKLFSLFPNPTTSEIKVESGKEKIEVVEIYDVMGQRMKRLTPNPSPAGERSASIDVSEFAAGIYFVKVLTEKGAAAAKFVKQ